MNSFIERLDRLPDGKRAIVISQLPPLSFAQERLWFLNELEPNSSSYNISVSIRLEGNLNVAMMEKALTEIVRRHHILRTFFPVIDDEPRQVILPARALRFREKDLTEMEQQQGEAEAYRLAQLEALSPFDLQGSPPLRLLLIRLSDSLHVLSVSLHHIIADGWSMGVLVREVALLYEAYTKGEASPLAELPIQYADYAVWQRQRVESGALEHQRSYWERKLRGAEAKLELATDRARPAVQSYRGGRQRLEIGEEEVRRLKEVGQQEGATLYMVMLAGFGVLMRSYSGQEEVLVGTPVAGRWREEMEGLIGLMVNTVVMKVKVRGEASVREVVRGVREEAIEAYENEELPYEKVVEAVRPGRDVSHTPIVQVMMALQNAPTTDFRLQGLSLNIIDIDMEAAKFDLAFDLREGPGGLTCEIEYNKDLFDPSTIVRMLNHFKNLLGVIIEDPDRRIHSLSVLSEAEMNQALMGWNGAQTSYPEACIHELFEDQVTRTPDATAVVFGDERLSYRELDQRANQLAGYLKKLGVRPEVLVGICLERSIEMIVSVLAVFKAGGAYVPLDPTYPQERLSFMVQDSHAAFILTSSQLLDTLPAHPAHIVCLDTDSEIIAGECKDSTRGNDLAENLAYVIYTSGSTGKLKGVLITHGGVVNTIREAVKEFIPTGGSHVLQFASLSFDASIFEILLALLSGSALRLVAKEVILSGHDLTRFIRDHCVSLMSLPPSLLDLLDENDLTELRTIIVGAEACHAETAARWSQRRRFINAYGPTEASIISTFFDCSKPFRKSPPIGRPLANTKVYLLDSDLKIVPVGVVGELHISGAGLARGYLNHTGLTAQAFIPNPFATHPGQRLYKTGDLARYLPDGNIEFVGRIDDQVKIRGYRVELGEIEAVMAEHTEVREAVIVARQDQFNNKVLAGFFVPKDDSPIIASDLRYFLKTRLPAYMTPSTLTLVETLPRTPSGKIDRRALLALERSRPGTEHLFVEPRTEAERLIAKIWAEILGIEQVGIHDNFFELGGHSLMVTRVVSRLQDAFEVELSVRTLFQMPTVADLAVAVSQMGRNEQALQAPPKIPRVRRGNKRVGDLLTRVSELSENELIIAMGGESPKTAN